MTAPAAEAAPLFTAPEVHRTGFPEGEWPSRLQSIHKAAQGEADAFAAAEYAADLAARLEQDTHLTTEGMRAKFTDAMATPLTKLAKHAERLDALVAREQADAAKLAEQYAPAVLSPAEQEGVERHGEALGRQDAAGRNRTWELACTKYKQDAAALKLLKTYGHCAWYLTGLSSQAQQERALAMYTAHMQEQAPQDQREQVAERARLVGSARSNVAAVRAALEAASDRVRLREQGIPTQLRRSDLGDDAAKAAWIAANGLDAFKALPG